MDRHPRRTLIFSILKLIIGAVIAIALVKFAFFPTQEKIITPNAQGDFTLPTTTVEKGSISHELSLPATVVRNETSPVKSTVAGQVVKLMATNGATVNAGAPIIQVKQTQESADGETPPKVTWVNVAAPAAGTLSLDVIVGQDVAIGDAIGQVSPDSFHAQVQVTPDQLYSLQSLPNEAELAIKDGPAPFACVNLKTVTAAPAAPKDGGDTPANASGPQLRCDIPADQRVVDGISAKLRIPGGNADNVLVIPVTAVEGRYREGRVYLPAQGKKKPEPVTVELGISDGQMIEVKSGLDEGQEILEFVPRSDDEPEPQGS